MLDPSKGEGGTVPGVVKEGDDEKGKGKTFIGKFFQLYPKYSKFPK